MSFIDELKIFEILEGERLVIERLKRMGLVGERRPPLAAGSVVIQFPSKGTKYNPAQPEAK